MITLTLLTSLLVAGAPPSGPPDYTGAARAMATELAQGDFAAAAARFEPAIAQKLPAPALAKQWQQVVGGLGAFQRLGAVRSEAAPNGQVVFVECVYERGPLHLKIGLNRQLQVGTLRPVPGQSPQAMEAAGRAVVADLAAGKFTTVVRRFSPTMAAALPADQLQAAWGSLAPEAGAFRKMLDAKLQPAPPLTIVDVTCAFSKKDLTVRVVLDGALAVQGLFFRPAWNAPAYVSAKSFEESPLTVGTKALPLPGVLTLPRGKGPFPAVVLVHGSGPNDADESMGPNRLFKDLAWGLASQKVAVLRYPKRTFHYQGTLSNADITTVKEETLDDALSAVAALASVKKVDPKRIFIVGHSMGASLAPRLAAAEPKVHGIVLLAGATRKQWHLMVEQVRYLYGLQGAPGPAGQQAIAEAEANARRLDAPTLKPQDVVMGIGGTYWLDMRKDDEVGTAAALGRPILVLQGERDYQVTMTDFAGWKKALGKRKNATLKSYPALNHHFMPGTGKSTPAEYEQPNHVPKELIDDLARWLKAH